MKYPKLKDSYNFRIIKVNGIDNLTLDLSGDIIKEVDVSILGVFTSDYLLRTEPKELPGRLSGWLYVSDEVSLVVSKNQDKKLKRIIKKAVYEKQDNFHIEFSEEEINLMIKVVNAHQHYEIMYSEARGYVPERKDYLDNHQWDVIRNCVNDYKGTLTNSIKESLIDKCNSFPPCYCSHPMSKDGKNFHGSV
tara:strand:+ start:198 stop:773 length:576 start_codon:yes stop_codon:yes gene_type:complete